ncbi:MFS transporter [Brucella rhizosphaerae]|uniref:Transmembrane secretion effector family protein n=1 Tax=Brucella rhizosphaerae TaxID=571254 RepID=A0A256FX83_9HYPH|nr:MFS transporter [Brucella rhizosphaerae]OYR19457.1 transmembrane secretion effector family protein [Brucella rhizosphaerae]
MKTDVLTGEKAEPLWAPLRNRLFRSLWMANTVSNLGTWMQGMGAAWLMAQLSQSTQMVALVQTAVTLPVFLFVVPAGILADRTNRASFLLVTHGIMALGALGLGIVISSGQVTPGILLLGTFLIGSGAALTMPAWQAAVSTLIEPQQIHSAAALNGMSFNFARTVGPAAAGFIAQAATVAAIFWINAVSFFGMIFVFWRWRAEGGFTTKEQAKTSNAASSFVFASIMRHNAFRSLLLRTFICFFGASSMWSLLPAFAALNLNMKASEVGLLMGTIGAGAVLGGVLIPNAKAKLGINHLIGLASLKLGLALIFTAWNGVIGIIWLSMVLTGVGWAFIVSGLNGTAQIMFPKEIRARAISTYLMAMYGGTTLGSFFWGVLSSHTGVNTTFLIAGTLLILSPLLGLRWKVQ